MMGTRRDDPKDQRAGLGADDSAAVHHLPRIDGQSPGGRGRLAGGPRGLRTRRVPTAPSRQYGITSRSLSRHDKSSLH